MSTEAQPSSSSGTDTPSANQQADQSEVLSQYRTKHVLQNSWTLWYDNPGKRVSQMNWSEYIKKLNTFHTVEDFWCLYNNIVPPSQLVSGSNFHLFKEGIEPKWEDPANASGGKWILIIPRGQRAQLDEYWLKSILSLIGENYEESDEICGCVISIRKAQDKIAVWTRNPSNKSATIRIGEDIKRFLELPPDVKIGYQVHSDSMRHNSSYNNANLYEV